MSIRLVLGLGFSLLMGCGASRTSGADDVSLPTPGSAPDREAAVSMVSAPLSGWKPELHTGPTIGQACPPPSAGAEEQFLSQAVSHRPRAEPVCGTHGRVSLEIVRQASTGLTASPPCQPASLETSGGQGYSRAFCVVGDELVVSTACYMCRMINVGEVAHARLSELTPEQNQMLSQIAGLPTPPRDANEWRALSARAQAASKQPPALVVPPP